MVAGGGTGGGGGVGGGMVVILPRRELEAEGGQVWTVTILMLCKQHHSPALPTLIFNISKVYVLFNLYID